MASKGMGPKGMGPIKPVKAPVPPIRQKSPSRQQVIPEAVSNRMARRIAIATSTTAIGLAVPSVVGTTSEQVISAMPSTIGDREPIRPTIRHR